MEHVMRVVLFLVALYVVGFVAVFLSRVGLRNSSYELKEIGDGMVDAVAWPWFALKGFYEICLRI